MYDPIRKYLVLWQYLPICHSLFVESALPVSPQFLLRWDELRYLYSLIYISHSHKKAQIHIVEFDWLCAMLSHIFQISDYTDNAVGDAFLKFIGRIMEIRVNGRII